MVWPWVMRNGGHALDRSISPADENASSHYEEEYENQEIEDSINRLIELSLELESNMGVNFHQYNKSIKLIEELADLYMDLKCATQQFHTQCQCRYQFRKALPEYQKLIDEAEKKIAMLIQIRANFVDLPEQKINDSEYCKEEDETDG